jgi:hypothetical protein
MKIDKTSAVWQAIEAHLNARLQKLRIENDRQMLEHETVRVRSDIAAIKYLLGLADRPEPIEASAPEY